LGTDVLRADELALRPDFSVLLWIKFAGAESGESVLFRSGPLVLSLVETTFRIKLEKSFDFAAHLLVNQWNFVEFSCRSSQFTLSHNLRPIGIQEISPPTLRGVIFGQSSGPSQHLIGYIGIVPNLTPAQTVELFCAGPAAIPANFVFGTARRPFLSLRKGFAQVILDHLRFVPLIPIFSHRFATASNLDQILSILEFALTFLPSLQTDFHQNEKVEVISHLLLCLDNGLISFSLYLRFYSIYCSVSSPHVRDVLLDQILLRDELWAKAAPADRVKITTHWIQVLVFCARASLLRLRPFRDLLARLSLFYKFADDEPAEICECRNLMRTFVIEIAEMSLTKSDLQEVICLCLTSTDNRMTEEMLVLLRLLVFERQSWLLQMQFEMLDVVPLLALHDRHDSTLIIRLVQATAELFKQGILSTELFPVFLQLIISKLPKTDNLHPIFSFALSELVNGSSHLVAYVCWHAVVVEQSQQSVLIDIFRKIQFPDVTSNPCTTFWPVVMCLSVPELFPYIIKASGKCWPWILAALEVICSALGRDFDEVCSTFLTIAFESIDDHEDLFRIGALMVLFRRKKRVTPALRQLYRASPFQARFHRQSSAVGHTAAKAFFD
jgi:hypothetical protein